MAYPEGSEYLFNTGRAPFRVLCLHPSGGSRLFDFAKIVPRETGFVSLLFPLIKMDIIKFYP